SVSVAGVRSSRLSRGARVRPRLVIVWPAVPVRQPCVELEVEPVRVVEVDRVHEAARLGWLVAVDRGHLPPWVGIPGGMPERHPRRSEEVAVLTDALGCDAQVDVAD